MQLRSLLALTLALFVIGGVVWVLGRGDREVEVGRRDAFAESPARNGQVSPLVPNAMEPPEERTPSLSGQPKALTEVAEDPRVDSGWGFDEEPTRQGPPGWISGEVVDTEGNPLAEATVEVENLSGSDRRVTTDEVGRFSVRHFGGDFELSAEKSGYASITRAECELEPGRDRADIRLVLAAARVVKGLVVNADEAPVSGARLSVEIPGGQTLYGMSDFETSVEGKRSDANGRFALEAVPAVPLELFVTHSSYPFEKLMLRPNETDVKVNLGSRHLDAKLEGRVIAPNGEPVAGAQVRIRSTIRSPQASTDKNGRFEAKLVHPTDLDLASKIQPLQVFVRAEGYAVFHETFPPIEPGTTRLEVRLEHGLGLAGVVLDQEGLPVYRATVKLECEEELWPGFSLTDAAKLKWETADDTGAFRFEDLWDTEFKLIVFARGQRGPRAEVFARAGREDVVIRLGDGLEDKVRFRVRVSDKLTQAPLEDAHVRTYATELGHGGAASYVIEQGLYEILAGKAGPWGLSVEVEGYAPWFVPLAERAAGLHEFEAELLRGRPFRLRVLDAAGAPIARARIRPMTMEGARLATDEVIPVRETPRPLDLIETGPNGYVRFAVLPRTLVLFEVTGPDGDVRRTHFDLAGERPEEGEIRF